jgi:hypothetical protein
MAMSDGRDFDDELRGAMRAEADRAQPDPTSWSRIEERRTGRRSARAWRWGAVAVAVAAAAVLVAVLVWPRDDGDEVITVDSTAVTTVLPDVTLAPTTEPATSAAPTTEATTTTSPTTTTTVPAVDHPTTAVAVTEDGRLVVLDTSGPSAVEVRELDRGPDPRIVPQEGETAVLDYPALTPDGRTVYYTLCCEPVVGVLFSAAVDGSSPPVNLGYGTFPAVSPTGDRLAIVQYDTIVVRDLAGGAAEQSFPDTEHAGLLIDLAWAADGRSLYYVRYEGTTSQLVHLPLDSGQAEVIATSETGLRFPIAGADGTVTVVEQCCAYGAPGAEPGVVLAVGAEPRPIEQLGLPLVAREARGVDQLRVDAEWTLIWARLDPAAAGAADLTTLGGPYRDAAW